MHAGRLPDRLTDRRRDQVEVVLRRHCVVGDEDLVDRAEERRADRRREHGHERDQRDPDHQSAGIRARALRVAGCVLAREHARRAGEAVARNAEHRGDRPDQLR